MFFCFRSILCRFQCFLCGLSPFTPRKLLPLSPPSPWNFQWSSEAEVWIFSGTTHSSKNPHKRQYRVENHTSEHVPRLCSKENWREPGALKLSNPGYPACDLYEKNYDFQVAQWQKLGARGHWALLEHNPVYNYFHIKLTFCWTRTGGTCTCIQCYFPMSIQYEIKKSFQFGTRPSSSFLAPTKWIN